MSTEVNYYLEKKSAESEEKVSAFGEFTLIIYLAISVTRRHFFRRTALNREVSPLEQARYCCGIGLLQKAGECYSRDYLCSPRHRVRAFTFLIDDFVLLPPVHKKPREFPLIKATAALHLIRHLHNHHLTVRPRQRCPPLFRKLCIIIPSVD